MNNVINTFKKNVYSPRVVKQATDRMEGEILNDKKCISKSKQVLVLPTK